ncbi:MAG: hypothetical protein QM535_06825 [Limnohabitans sp.]|nr:hypothetical protein [Limnohabitans sp.]
MFQLYKDRKFGDYISDTIDFFKKLGKHYFKNYFVINGVFLMILCVLFYFFGKLFSELAFSQHLTNDNYMRNYIAQNGLIFSLSAIVLVLLMIIMGMLCYAFPTIYAKLYQEKGSNFETKDIINSFKEHFGRLILFPIASFFIIFPIIVIIFFFNVFLSFLIIGIPLFFITIPAMIVFVSLCFNDYIIEKNDFFKALGNGFKMLFNNFWPTTGATLITFFIIYILQMIITITPSLLGEASFFTTGNDFINTFGQNDSFNSLSILMVFILILSMLVGLIFQNFLFIQQVLIYYSQVENKELKQSNDELELIGNGE